MRTETSGRRRTVFAWGRIPAEAGSAPARSQEAFGRYPRSEQLSIFPERGERRPAVRELRLPCGGPAPLPGPWILSAVVSGSSRA